MANGIDDHWSATANLLTVGPFPGSFFAWVWILPFYHPTWFIVVNIVWMSLVYWLHRKGLGIKGLAVLLRRWMQGKRLPSSCIKSNR